MQADKTVKEGDVLHLADFEIHVLATPGHTAGGVCYYIPAAKTLFPVIRCSASPTEDTTSRHPPAES